MQRDVGGVGTGAELEREDATRPRGRITKELEPVSADSDVGDAIDLPTEANLELSARPEVVLAGIRQA